MTAVPDTVYVVVVNWNGWRDTIECLESVFRSRYPHYRVVVCDNGSSDGSLGHIRAWANGLVAASSGDNETVAGLVRGPVAKPIPYVELGPLAPEERETSEARLVLVDTGANLGFAGGCNAGLRYAMSQRDCGFVWLVNNDTVVDPNALGALVGRLRATPDAGQCGSRLLQYHDPTIVQTLGGERYNRWLGRVSPIGAGRPADAPVDEGTVEASMSYVVGASLCVTRAFVEQVGLLDESYFLYYEELDWSVRSRGRFTMAYADDSIVYHKEGRSTGLGRNGSRSNASADFFLLRNRLRFTWRYAPIALPTVLLGFGVTVLNRIRRGQFGRIPMIFRVLFSRETYRPR